MSEYDRHGSDLDPTYDRSQPGKYIPLENVDKGIYDIIHPENAMIKLGMSARTAYRKIDSGDIEYTLDKGSKRILVRRDLTSPNNLSESVGQHSFNGQNQSDMLTDFSTMSPTFEKLLDALPNYKQMLVEKEEDIRQLREEVERLKTKQHEDITSVRQKCQTEVEQIRIAKEEIEQKFRDEINNLKSTHQSQIADLKSLLEAERIAKVRMEGDVRRIEHIESTVDAQKETISTQKTTIEALNNERIVITQQLQKYRSQDEPWSQESKAPVWMFWKRK